MDPILNYKVRELHIDLLFLEEFYSSDSFNKWFLTRTIGTNHATHVIRTDHSVYELERESDLEILYGGIDWEVLFLIENKINASFQKEQAEDYLKRAEEYVRRGKCTTCYTVLFAPSAYIEQFKSVHHFHFYVSFEQLIEFFQQERHIGRRAQYKINVLSKAIEKYKVKKGSSVPSEVNQGISDFWYHYWQDVTQRYPDFPMPKPGDKGPAATFIGLGKSKLPKNVFIYHKFVHGAVDLQFEGLSEHADSCIELLKPHIEADMSIQRAGKAAVVIRLLIPPINPHHFYDEVQQIVFEAQDHAKRLFDWFIQHQKYWDEFCIQMNAK